MQRVVASVLAAIALVAASTLLPAAEGAAAWARDDGDGKTTWSVAPADAGGPDGRHWFELELAPGGRASELLAVTNLSDHKAAFDLAAADGYFNRNGRFGMLAVPTDSEDAGLWIKVESRAEVEAGETMVIPFTITVPNNAEPGDHAAGIAASVAKRSEAQSGAKVGVTSRFGVRVMIRVTGDLKAAIELRGVKARYAQSWNLLRPGRIRAGFDFVNTGNVRLTVACEAVAAGSTAAYPDEQSDSLELLPGETRHVDLELSDVWPLFRVSASISVDAEPIITAAGDETVLAVQHIEREVSALAIPLPQALAALAIALALVAAVAGRSRSKRRIRTLIAEAREQGRAEALPSASPGAPLTRRGLRQAKESGAP
jgi:hypothetical protein